MEEVEDIEQIAEALRRGGVMLYPTDTLWGLGCDATNAAAVAKIFAIKQRADAKSLIVLVDGEKMLHRYVREAPTLALDIVRLSSTPQTIIYSEGVGFANGVCAADGSVAIRIANHLFCKKTIRSLGRPIVSTSANISGANAPKTFAEIPDAVRQSVNVQVCAKWEGRPTRKPSGIIRLEADGRVEVIR
ncbi:MAG: threonylcarbamoyl-AMP synthase [Prevotellaceae bacterium]|jgi:L-threonylcarbamoyladenylate synthase|nr:threonylcarbamoyl-AMP synthase [Prevotellaceae bacterium]